MFRGYTILFVSVLIQLCLGGVYAWSEFVPALAGDYGLNQAQTQIIFGSTIAVFTVSMIFAGRMQDKYGPAPVALIGGVLFGGGYLLASASGGNFWILLAGIGFVAGTGIGFGYVCPIATCIKWFPNRKGLVSGLAVAGFGGGAILLSALASRLFTDGKNVLEVFRIIGLVYGAVIIGASFLLANPKGFSLSESSSGPDIKTGFMRDRAFWRLFIGMWAGTFAGLLVVGNLKPIGLASNAGEVFATAAISSFAIGNGLGRLSWGILTDKIGAATIPASLLFLALAVAAMIFNFPSGLPFVIIAGLTGFGFGACFVVYMAETVNEYGAHRLGSVYPLIFLAYGVSGIIGPTVGGWLYDLSESYMLAIVIAAAVAGGGALSHRLLR